ncbi:MAG: hypothetical protein ABIR59_05885 [Gemmatimonadales bacterium]
MIRSRNRAFVLLAAAFSIGLLMGGMVLMAATRAGKADILWRGDHRSMRGAGSGAGGPATWIARELDLTAATRDSADAIYRRMAVEMDSLRARIRPQVDSLYEIIRPDVEARRLQMRTEIRALLTPPQREKYDSIVTKDDDNRRRMREQGQRFNGGGRGTR